MKVWIIGGLLFVAGMAACAGEVNITAETASGTQGAGGAGSSGATGRGSAVSSSAGTGGPGPGLTRVVTADTDIGQSVFFTTTSVVSPEKEQKVIEGPFFITDAISEGMVPLHLVQGNDCGVSEDKLIPLVMFYNQAGSTQQIHGVRIPVLAGQTICAIQGNNAKVTVLGFRPY
jgi:hypothetical protein